MSVQFGLEESYIQDMSAATQLADKLSLDCTIDSSIVFSLRKELDHSIYVTLIHLNRLSQSLTEERMKLYINTLGIWAKLIEWDEFVNIFKVSPGVESKEICRGLSATEIKTIIKLLLRGSFELMTEVVCVLLKSVRDEIEWRKPVKFLNDDVLQINSKGETP